ncbi:hypothetical protein CC85DRAFT_285226 [Cutaneotrichosporon oleaginosum]|uniref:Zn(2)-C6 fungal-type domain-containing protein n=1 Tax=Cutaneotrichosporon oleaginosum TaxID=879819 RepID=A0A0J0XNH7_9TREE|nr:uncharacterized protein CC85DRAFT_285226 [Cutaneotrichosporon oleaginosum]KLT42685.1 hypothetical protein CC85DRAFT_285226 [Cutaneotrichosporon oleaginosum]TXT09594.1 hypothetical protein COLE_03528 [Cutaneotrichosporon oleaginosum]
MSRRSRSPSPRKRPKIFRACAACVSSKTRCEDVTSGGCALCRRRGKPCSLSAVVGGFDNNLSGVSTPAPVSAAAVGRSAGSSADEDVRARLADAEARLARTERALADLEARVSGAGTSTSGSYHPHYRIPEEERHVLFAGPLRLSALQLEGHDETLWSVACTRAYPDPVGRGLLSPAEAELAWHGFKARAARLLPIPPFTAVSTPLPGHGFVLLAALHHVPALVKDQRALRGLVDECMALAMGSHASVDVVLALLIMSLAPPLPDDGAEGAPITPTAWRMVSLARSMCLAMGLEARALAAVRKGEELNDAVWADSLWLLQLWCAVSNRYALLSLMYPQPAPPTPLALRLPRLVREQLEAANVHLRSEAHLVMAFTPFVTRFAAVERESEWNHEDMRDLVAAWDQAKDAAADVAAANPQSPSIGMDARIIEFTLHIRIALFLTWLPSPLKDMRETVLQCLRKFPRNMTAVLDIVTPARDSPSPILDTALIPEYAVLIAAAAVIVFRRSVRYVATAYPDAKLIEGGRLDDAARSVRTLGRAARFIITEGEKLLADADAHTDLAEALWPGHAVPGQNIIDFDLMSFDLSVLYPDIIGSMEMGL